MYTLAIFTFVVFVSFLPLFLLKKSDEKGEFLYRTAHKSEKKGDFEKACFFYATASMAGFQKETANEKVRILSKQHGPFNFNEQLNQLDHECIGLNQDFSSAFHYLTLKHIETITA